MNNRIKSQDLDYLLMAKVIANIRKKGYKPSDDINKFWAKYRLQEGFAYAYEIFLRMKGKKDNLQASEEELEEYIEDLMSVIIGYYFSHLNVFEKGEVIIDEEKSFLDKVGNRRNC